MVSKLVICHSDTGTPLAAVPTEVVFVPPTMIVSVSSGTQLGVDGKAVAHESDIESNLGNYVSMAGLGSDASVGVSSFSSITSITLSTVLEKDSTFVVLKETVDFEMNIGTTWMIPGTPPVASTIYTSGSKISCSLSWLLTQIKLKAS